MVALPHSNGFLEIGFSDLKRLITGSELLSLELTSAQDMIERIKLAHEERTGEKTKRQGRGKEEIPEEVGRTTEGEEKDKEKKSWDEKYKGKAGAIEVLKEKHEIQNKTLDS